MPPLPNETDELPPGSDEESGGTPNPSTGNEPFKFGDDAPEWMRGKTVAEVAEATSRLAGQNQLLQSQLETVVSRPAPAPAPAPAPSSPDFEPADFLEAGAGVKEKLEQLVDIKTRPYAERMLILQQAQVRAQAEKAFPHLTDYAQEVDTILSRLDPAVAAQPVTWHTINSHILNTHFDEIAQRRAATKAKPRPPSDGAPRPGATGEAAAAPGNLSAEEKHIAKMMGISEADWLAEKKEMGL